MSRLVPQFPSYTFPNHFSLVTGLYPEAHGIVSNAFFDPQRERFFYFTNATTTMHADFWNAEPIWNVNQEQGGKSGVLHYPGSDVAINGKHPSKYEAFTDQVTSKERINKMLQWMDEEPEQNLSVLYFDEVDHAGHVYGPDSREVMRSLKSVDRAIGDLLNQLKKRDNFDEYNIVIVSDHGMTEASDDKKIYLDKIIPFIAKMTVWADYGPIAAMIPKPEYKHHLGVILKRAIRKHRLPIRLYTKETMPKSYHYTNNDRIPEYVLEAKAGWTIDTSEVDWHPKGLHGYGHSVREMDGIFIGNGPAFRINAEPSYPMHSNLDVYPLMCQLLGIEAKSHNGTTRLIAHSTGTESQSVQ